jgi:UDP-4-amino-4,6-dideoxy-N-acetyl-beta-L-altrosamine transaminase
MIPYGKQDITQKDIDAVIDALTSENLTQGPLVTQFEEALSSYLQSNFGVAVNSATSGLHIACLSLGLSEGDIVWTSPISFVASANCALYCGASIDFVDIDLVTHNISIELLKEKLEQAERDEVLPKILIPVHLSGLPCEMKEIFELSKKYGFKIIEDASHAIGSKYSIQKNSKVGNCEFSDITVFSFHPVKIITTGEGGLCCTNDIDLAAKMHQLKAHGVNRNIENFDCDSNEKWNYAQESIGFNYRMTELQAALGLSQFTRLEQYIKKRNEIRTVYDEHLSNLPLQLPKVQDDVLSSTHLYIVKFKEDKLKNRNNLYEHLVQSGIGVNLHYIPIYRHPFYLNLGFKKGHCPNAEHYFQSAISIPVHQSMSEEDVKTVIDSVMSFFE